MARFPGPASCSWSLQSLARDLGVSLQPHRGQVVMAVAASLLNMPRDPSIQIKPTMENHIEQKMEYDAEVGGLMWDASTQIIFTLGPTSLSIFLPWAIWIPKI